MSSNLPIWENLSILESILKYVRIYLEICPAIINIKKHGLPKFASGPPLGGTPDGNSGTPWNRVYSPPCRTPCRLFIHEVFFGPLGLHLRVWSEFGRSPPFWPMRALRLQWSWAFSLLSSCGPKWDDQCTTYLALWLINPCQVSICTSQKSHSEYLALSELVGRVPAQLLNKCQLVQLADGHWPAYFLTPSDLVQLGTLGHLWEN